MNNLQAIFGRSAPHVHLPGIGRSGQDRLRRSRVLIAGVGGLGAPAALYLAAAGVGTVGLLDADTVELSNLHRQILYRTADLGRPKVEVARERLGAMNPDVSVECFLRRLSADNLAELFHGFDFVIDGTDQVATKYLINDGAVLHGVAFSHAGILGFQGQALTVLPRRSACLRCLFPTPPVDGDIPTCQEAGVVGALAGTIGVVQATEAVKYLLGIGSLLADRLLAYDALRARWRLVALSRNRLCPLCGDEPTIRRLELVANPAEIANKGELGFR